MGHVQRTLKIFFGSNTSGRLITIVQGSNFVEGVTIGRVGREYRWRESVNHEPNLRPRSSPQPDHSTSHVSGNNNKPYLIYHHLMEPCDLFEHT